MLCVRTAVQALLAVRLALAGIQLRVLPGKPLHRQFKCVGIQIAEAELDQHLAFLLVGVDTAAHQFLRFLAADAAVEPGVFRVTGFAPQCGNVAAQERFAFFRGHLRVKSTNGWWSVAESGRVCMPESSPSLCGCWVCCTVTVERESC